jgi:hypothetical protein
MTPVIREVGIVEWLGESVWFTAACAREMGDNHAWIDCHNLGQLQRDEVLILRRSSEEFNDLALKGRGMEKKDGTCGTF